MKTTCGMEFAEFCSRKTEHSWMKTCERILWASGMLWQVWREENVLYFFVLSPVRFAGWTEKSFKLFCFNDFVLCLFTDHVDSHIVRIDFGHSVWHLSLLDKHREPTGEKAFTPQNMAFVETNNFIRTSKNNFILWLFQFLNTRHYGGELTRL